MKSLRKRALAKAAGKRYKRNRDGGFDVYDRYGSVGLAFGASHQFVIELITSAPASKRWR